jgi:hypothetical protein
MNKKERRGESRVLTRSQSIKTGKTKNAFTQEKYEEAIDQVQQKVNEVIAPYFLPAPQVIQSERQI